MGTSNYGYIISSSMEDWTMHQIQPRSKSKAWPGLFRWIQDLFKSGWHSLRLLHPSLSVPPKALLGQDVMQEGGPGISEKRAKKLWKGEDNWMAASSQEKVECLSQQASIPSCSCSLCRIRSTLHAWEATRKGAATSTVQDPPTVKWVDQVLWGASAPRLIFFKKERPLKPLSTITPKWISGQVWGE